MRHFKLPLIVTGITLLLAIIVGVVIITSIHSSHDSNSQKNERAQMAGGAVAIATLVVNTPFWLFAAAKVGSQRREARQSRSRTRHPTRR
jgi:hypothetical protein